MPLFRIETNVPKSKVPDDFLKTTSKLIAKVLSKPESYCAVLIVPEQMMSFGGSTEPTGQASLMSIGQLGVAQNKVISAALFKHIEETLGIPQNRMYITFTDSPTSVVGYQGTTFHEIFG
ncbi:hypothetical protein LSTR_LSTR000260 [Laodelphax striatellus]|uniref:L-dopachrome isomerase n=1 Tax=Laodelphax striatellus TaxID=195883 RepID=A0A482X7A8_LAOST|nr:hypothetical protein LSTR_LSTR000260 [Laodelphax striatellus]